MHQPPQIQYMTLQPEPKLSVPVASPPLPANTGPGFCVGAAAGAIGTATVMLAPPAISAVAGLACATYFYKR